MDRGAISACASCFIVRLGPDGFEVERCWVLALIGLVVIQFLFNLFFIDLIVTF